MNSKTKYIILLVVAVVCLIAISILGMCLYNLKNKDTDQPEPIVSNNPSEGPINSEQPIVYPTDTINDPIITPLPSEEIMTDPTTEPIQVLSPTSENITFAEFQDLSESEQEEYLFIWDEDISYSDAIGIELELIEKAKYIKYSMATNCSIERDGYIYRLLGESSGRISRVFPKQKAVYVLSNTYSINDFLVGETYDIYSKSLWKRVNFEFYNKHNNIISTEEIMNKLGNLNVDVVRYYKSTSKEFSESYYNFILNFSNNFEYYYSDIINTFTEIDFIDFNNGNSIAKLTQTFNEPIIVVSFDNGITWQISSMTSNEFAQLLTHTTITYAPIYGYGEEINPDPTFIPHTVDIP